MKISKSCYAVTGLGFTPPWFVNAGIIAGEKGTVIIDTGGNYNSAATIFGYAKAVSKTEKFLAINTEPHFDHILGNNFFAEKEIPIYGHKGIIRTSEEFIAQKWEMNETIMDAKRKKLNEEEAFFSKTELKNPDRFLENGQIFNVGESEVEIIFTPGHTKFNLSVWHKKDMVLFSGDTIVNNFSPNLECGTKDDWKIWKDSIKLIESLKPEVIVPGHGDVIFKIDIPTVLDRLNKFLDTAIASM